MCPPPNLIAHVIFSFVRGYLAPEIYVLAAPAGWFNSWTTGESFGGSTSLWTAASETPMSAKSGSGSVK
jgi:hypothetical protein